MCLGVELFAIWPLLVVGLVRLLSGAPLGLGTPYGLLRYWWVAVKLATGPGAQHLVIVLLGPGTRRAGSRAGTGAAGPVDQRQPRDAPTVTIVCPTVAVWLLVAKPWGRNWAR